MSERLHIREQTARIIWRMPKARRRAVVSAWREADRQLDQRDAGPKSAGAEEAEAAAAFERDMAPICEAVATAIRTKDRAAFEGLKAMFAPMLADANEQPALAEILRKQIGAALLSGLRNADFGLRNEGGEK